MVALAVLAGAPRPGEAQPGPRFLTPPRAGDPVEIAVDYVRSEPESIRARRADLDEFRVDDRSRSRRSGVTHVRLRQQIGGIDVWDGDLAVHVTRDGRVLAVHDRFVPRTRRAVAGPGAPLIPAEAAVRNAVAELGLPEPALTALERPGGPAQEVVFARGALSREPIRARLVYVRGSSAGVRLAWNFTLWRAQTAWEINVDAVAGDILTRASRIENDAYRVFPFPLNSPDDGGRSLEVNPADPTASPFGWHDTNGSPGADRNDTRGNNVRAQEDTNGNDSGGFRPSGGGSRVFDFPLDLARNPDAYEAASITNLFYWNNLLHDLHYHYGFDEAAGNMQQNNYGNGGQDGDPLIVDALDGSGFDNAQILVKPDGQSPRMEMFLWRNPFAVLRVDAPASVAGDVEARGAAFGVLLDPAGLSGPVVQALDAPDPDPDDPFQLPGSTTDGCSPFTNASQVAGKIALIDRGICLFVQKIANAEAAGAIGVVIVNHTPNELIVMGGDPLPIGIPSLFIRLEDGNRLKAELAAGLTVTLRSDGVGAWDSAFDNGTVIHEYGHAVSARLTGGPSVIACLDLLQADGMSEGWSDFWELALTSKADDEPEDPRTLASYLLGQPPGGVGIRNYPYSTDLGVNPLTYAAIRDEGLNRPHGVGEVWAVALWELYWDLVASHGFDPDWFGGSGGNQIALQLVMDALALQPCNPTMVEGRDALLAADLAGYGGAHECAIWRAFAKRGMGVGADDGGSANSNQVAESFDEPLACPEPGAGGATAAALLALAGLRRGAGRARARAREAHLRSGS
ncbi:MAG: M36 family metallopeptidase [Myxococcota bacterium]|nr:M36 family metallopeptidase [Myxococcota bacterium]